MTSKRRNNRNPEVYLTAAVLIEAPASPRATGVDAIFASGSTPNSILNSCPRVFTRNLLRPAIQPPSSRLADLIARPQNDFGLAFVDTHVVDVPGTRSRTIAGQRPLRAEPREQEADHGEHEEHDQADHLALEALVPM